MSPARQLRILTARALAWGAVVLALSSGIASAQTTEPTAPPAPAVTATPSAEAPAPAQPPGDDGKSSCDNRFVKPFCAVGDVAKKLAEGDLPGAVSTVAAPVANAAGQAIQEGFAESISHWVADGATF
ncbi:MAG: hypothetical protein ACRDYF_02170, partial [Acidimicrobiia bacterium]